MHKIARCGALLILGCSWAVRGGCALPEEHIELPDFRRTPVLDRDLGHGVHMLESFGGNIGVIAGEHAVLLVDAEYPQLNAKVRAVVGHISQQPIRFVIDTHWHWDHVGANAQFARRGALIIASEQTRAHIVEAQAGSAAPGEPYARDPAALPTFTIGSGAKLYLADHVIEIIHVPPAHTDGDLIVRYLDADVLQTGDTFFHGFYPDIDVAHGGSIDGMIALYDTLYRLCGAQTRVIPGHGPVATREDIRTYQAMLREVRNRVARALAAGLSQEQLIAAHPLDDLDPQWGGNLIKAPYLLAVVYEDLKGHH